MVHTCLPLVGKAEPILLRELGQILAVLLEDLAMIKMENMVEWEEKL